MLNKKTLGVAISAAAMLLTAVPVAAATLDGTDRRDTLSGTNDADILRGFGGRDLLIGRGGDDLLIGGIGNDRSDGGSGNDTFVFSDGDGRDLIGNFGVGQSIGGGSNEGTSVRGVFQGFDVIVIQKAGFDSFEDIAPLIRDRFTANGRRTIIDFGDGDRIIFYNTGPNTLPLGFTGPELNPANFVFE